MRRGYIFRLVMLDLVAMAIVAVVMGLLDATYRDMWFLLGGMVLATPAFVIIEVWAEKVVAGKAARAADERFDRAVAQFRASNPHIEGMGGGEVE